MKRIILFACLFYFLTIFERAGTVRSLDDCARHIHIQEYGSKLIPYTLKWENGGLVRVYERFYYLPRPCPYSHISTLKYNNAGKNDILRLKIYFQGKADFSVVFTSRNNTSEYVFQTVLAHKDTKSAIFNELYRNYDKFDSYSKCGSAIDYPMNPFKEGKFQEVDVVLTKSGRLTWSIPNFPKLTCQDPDLGKIEYISFSGYENYTIDYKTDCEKDHVRRM